jgi:diguanylate cyclase (GGDEF)-like protein
MKLSASSDPTHDVIASIVSLTEQRDQRSLEHSLVSTLEDMLDDIEGWLLEMPTENNRDAGCTMLHGDKSHLPNELLAQGCRLPNDILTCLVIQGGLTYRLAKLQDYEQGRHHMLILAKQQWSETDLQVVEGLVRVYHNFVGILFDSEKDTLTGLYNRRKLDSKLKDIANSRMQGRRQTDKDHADFLAILDLDRFKRINDNFGHLIGDEVLLIFSNILSRTLRESDLIFRYGGEEFVVLLQDISGQTIKDVLERVGWNVENHDFPQVGKVTVSIGYAALESQVLPIQTMEKSDRALYYAKDHGRNRVCNFDQLLAEGELEGLHQDGSIELF